MIADTTSAGRPVFAYRWYDGALAHRSSCTASDVEHRHRDVRMFRYDYQLEYWLRAHDKAPCTHCEPEEFP